MKSKAIRIYQGGLSMNAVAKEVGVTGPTVARWLEEAGVAIRNRRPTYTDQLRREAITLYVASEMSARSVAEALGLRPFTVKEWVKSAGVMRSMSDAAALSIASGKARGRAASRLWYQSAKTGERSFAESSLEYLRMEQLDADEEVICWSRCRNRIPYVSPEGQRRHYNPDLIVTLADGSIVIEEIKPSSLVGTEINQAKIAAAKLFCAERGWGFRVTTEADVGYVRALAPSSLTKEERRERENALRRKRRAAETPEQRAVRLQQNADYMRRYNQRRREDGSFCESGTNICTTVATIRGMRA